jgi:hypothetical protein
MENDALLIIAKLILLFVAIVLFVFGGILRFQLEKEVKKGRTVLWNNFLPYWNKNDFSERGNEIRKQYNKSYYAFIFVCLLLFLTLNASP